jgi:hypothetical protein
MYPMMLEEDCAATITADKDEVIEVDIESCMFVDINACDVKLKMGYCS